MVVGSLLGMGVASGTWYPLKITATRELAEVDVFILLMCMVRERMGMCKNCVHVCVEEFDGQLR